MKKRFLVEGIPCEISAMPFANMPWSEAMAAHPAEEWRLTADYIRTFQITAVVGGMVWLVVNGVTPTAVPDTVTKLEAAMKQYVGDAVVGASEFNNRKFSIERELQNLGFSV